MIQQIQWCLKWQCQIELVFGAFGKPLWDELQHRPLGFWSNALPSSVDNYSPFASQFLASNWALETKHLTMGNKVTIRPELPLMNWVLSDPPSHKVGHAQQHSIIK